MLARASDSDLDLTASRRTVIGYWGGDAALSPFDKIKASAIAGGSTGFVAGMMRKYLAPLSGNHF